MNIRIQVMANQARTAIQQVSGDLTRMAGSAAAGAGGVSGAANSLSALGNSLTKSGSKMQWMGRQLTYNLTVPLVLAGTAATNFAMKNEAAMVRMQKVYGDASMSTQQMKNETAALGRTFEVLSEKYGIARDQTIGIAADWAAAGSSGIALAKQTELTMQTMVLGEMDATSATQSLIAIQAQYNQSANDLGDTIARLNNVENQTGTTMKDLIDSMARSAGVARASGVDVAHLAAMTAALVPAAGSASQAGNSLKTMMSRLLSPTKDAMDILGAMNIHITDASWKSADAATRIEMLAGHFSKLSDAQKQVVSATLASRYQINKFDVLMAAINDKSSYYWKALDAASNRSQYLAQVTKELNMVLDSSPKKMDRIKVILQNTLADAIQPLLPALISFGGFIANVARAFNNLSPNTQKLIIEFLLFLAVLGPLTSKLAVLKILLGVFISTLGFMLKIIAPVIDALWGMAAAIAGFAWDAFIGAMGIAAAGIGKLGEAFMWLVSPAKTAGAFILEIFWGMWAGIRTSWIVGLTSISSLAMGGFAVLGAGIATIVTDLKLLLIGMWVAPAAGWQRVLIPALQGIVGFFGATMAAIGRVMALAGPVLSAIWTAISVSLEVITVELGAGLAKAWTFIMAMIETVMVEGARALGVVWRATLVALEVITAEVGTGIAGIWRALQALLVTIQVAGGAALRGVAVVGMALFEGVLLATASVAGAIWRALQVGLVAIQVVGARMLGVVTAATGTMLATLWSVTSKGVLGLFSTMWKGMLGLAKFGGSLMMDIFTKLGPMLMKALTNPYVLAAVAVAILLYAFRDKLAGIWSSIVRFFQNAGKNIVDAFYALPKGVQSAMLAVVNIVKTAAMKVYELFSYLNPFAHHSPSLVENVTNGMAAVAAQFGTITSIKGPIDQAYVSIKNFKNAAADLAKGYDSIKTADEVATLSKAGASPGLIASYVSLAAQLSHLKDIQDQYQNAIDGQQAVVDSWQKKLDAANKVLDAQKNKLQDLQTVASNYQTAMQTMQTHLQALATAPLIGMKAMDDAIFSNQQAQKALQLQIAQMTTAASNGYQSVTDRVASLNGAIETLTSQKTDLRALGAGSEITDTLDKQIQGLESQKKTLSTSGDEVTKLNDQLATLQSQANILDLQKSLQFDGLTRSIDQAANGMQELPFDQVMAGVLADKAGLAALQQQYDAATAAVNAQQGAVDAAQASVDSIQVSYDAANQSLSDLKDQYQKVTQAIQDMNAAMQTANDAATGLKQAKDAKLSPTMEAFNAGAGGNFPDVGGEGMDTSLAKREGGPGDQSALIDDYTKKLQQQLGDAFGGFDMLGPFKDLWNKFMGYWDRDIWPFLKGVGKIFGSIFDGVDLGGGLDKIFGGIDWKGIFSKAWDVITNVVSDVWDFASMIWDFIGPDIKDIVDQIIGFFKTMGDKVGGVWGDIKERIHPFLDALQNLWDFAKPFLAFWAGEFVGGIIFAFKLLKNIVNPVLTFIGDMFSALWEIIRGILDLFIGIFTGDWKRVWDGFLSIFKGVWDVFLAILKGIGGLIWGVIKSVFETIVAIGSYLISGIAMGIGQAWDAFMSWIGDLWNGFIDWIKNLLGIHSPSTIMAEIGGFLIQGFLDGIKAVWNFVMDFIGGALQALGAVFGWLYDNVIKPTVEAWGKIFGWLWDNVLKPVFGFIGDALGVLGSVISWVWTNVVQPTIAGWGQIFGWLWDNVLKPIFGFIGDAFAVVAAGISWAWDNVLHPVWDAISTVIGWLWDNVLKPIFGFIGDAWGALIKGIGWYWDNILHPVWNVISDVIGWLWNNILKPIFKFIGDAWGALIVAIQWYWDNILHPVWDAISTIIGWLWNNVLKPIFGFIGDAWNALITGIKWVWDNILHPVWDAVMTVLQWLWDKILSPIFDAIGKAWNALGTGLKWVYDNVLHPMFDAFGTAVGALKSVFETVVGAIGTAWDGLKKIAAMPINFVIDTVLNHGLISAFNSVVGFFGLDSWKIKPLDTVSFAEGGKIDGPWMGPKADNVLGMVGKMPIRVNPREWIQPVASVDYYGDDVMAALQHRAIPKEALQAVMGFSDGGEIPRYNLGGGVVGETGGGGMTWPLLDAVRKHLFPGSVLTSAFRPGAADWHGKGDAIDIGVGGNVQSGLMPIAAKLAQMYPQSTELIHNPNGSIKNGKVVPPSFWGAATWAEHANHVHWAMSNAGLLNAQAGNDSGGGISDIFTDPMGFIEKSFTGLLDQIHAGKLGDWIKKTPGRIFEGVKNWAADKLSGAWNSVTGAAGDAWDWLTGGGGGSVQDQVKGVAKQHGWDTGAQWGGVDYVVSHESSWNPKAKNSGSTASGLGQFIDSTWMGLRGSSKASRMMDASVPEQGAALMRYFQQRYHDPVGAENFWKAHHWYNTGGQVFDTGGMLGNGRSAVNLSGKVERILSPEQTGNFEKLVGILGRVDFAKLDARVNGSQAASAPVTYNYTGDTTTININGDLSFPGINNGKDASTFLRNLADMSGGGRR